jgi:hypothetical protein
VNIGEQYSTALAPLIDASKDTAINMPYHHSVMIHC